MQYYEPNFVDEALVLLDRFGDGATLLAGGTRVAFAVREHPEKTAALVNLKRIQELTRIEEREATLRIGALATAHALAEDPAVKRHAPMLAEAAGSMGARQLRSIATVGGNICSFDPASDLVVALVAYGAELVVATSDEPSRFEPLESWLVRGVSNRREIVVAVHVPVCARRSAFAKMTTRRGFEMAIVSVAVCGSFESSNLSGVAIALGGTAPSVIRARTAEQILSKAAFSRERASAAARAAAERDAQPLSDLRASAEYRRHLVAVLAERALLKAFGASDATGS
ncbi:MAG TPA: FAD binding domain-containing protein [Candidatus Acidoferrales bacterium]|nr:FAD binding domain-containing protein [Candidatus Acidoferrales bacterium]